MTTTAGQLSAEHIGRIVIVKGGLAGPQAFAIAGLMQSGSHTALYPTVPANEPIVRLELDHPVELL